MGARKHNTAEAMKEARKEQYFAKLNNVPTSPRKMRLGADMIRGMEVNRALGALHFSTREASRAMEKVLKSAIANWETKKRKKADDAKNYNDRIATIKEREVDIEYMQLNDGNPYNDKIKNT